MHRTREESINTHLANALQREHGLDCMPESTLKGFGRKRPDVIVMLDDIRVIIEAKIGKEKQAEAEKQARLRIETGIAHKAIGLCYLNGIARSDSIDKDILTTPLKFGIIDPAQEDPKVVWESGRIKKLAERIKGLKGSKIHVGDRIINRLKDTIDMSAVELKAYQDRIRNVLQLDKQAKAENATKIGLLILTNALLFHDRLKDVKTGNIPKNLIHIRRPDAIQEDPETSLLDDLRQSWGKILRIDYFPIFDTALGILKTLENAQQVENALRWLVLCAFDIKKELLAYEHDLPGRIYHRLLDSADKDGSYYTSTPAAHILAHLALPRNFIDWTNEEAVAKLRICDPACGTGTLLSACKSVCEARGGGGWDELLHLTFIEDVLHGIDINPSAVHLAASTLAMANPAVSFNKMQIYRSYFGVEREGLRPKVYIGSPGVIDSKDALVEDTTHKQAHLTSTGETESVFMNTKMDLVIMNPPFTRNDKRHDQIPNKEDEKLIKAEEQKWLRKHFAGEQITLTTSSPIFICLAKLLSKDHAKLAVVLPFAACTSSAGLGVREFICKHWHIEYIITSHDPARIFFSESTNIHECLLIARRRQADTGTPTTFINLAKNPSDKPEAARFCEDLDKGHIGDWGTIQEQSAERMRKGDWSPAGLYAPSLMKGIQYLGSDVNGLVPFHKVAKTGTGGRILRDEKTFRRVGAQQAMRAMYYHKADKITKMRQSHDVFLVPQKGCEAQAEAIYATKASRLLIAERFWYKTMRLHAILADLPILGSAWATIQVADDIGDPLAAQRALCVWFNSSAGILSLMSIRSFKLSYPKFSLKNIRGLPVPDVRQASIRAPLAAAQARLADSELAPIPFMNTCPVRQDIDAVVADTLGIDPLRLSEWRQRITEEPSIKQVQKKAKKTQKPLTP